MHITASVKVAASVAHVLAWFRALETHPERYVFDTHQGFRCTGGTFGMVGGQFETMETFGFGVMRLGFEFVEVGRSWFVIELRYARDPFVDLLEISMRAQCKFSFKRHGSGSTVTLQVVTGDSWIWECMRESIQAQIVRELAHVQRQVEW